jgi:hypothetical protein
MEVIVKKLLHSVLVVTTVVFISLISSWSAITGLAKNAAAQHPSEKLSDLYDAADSVRIDPSLPYKQNTFFDRWNSDLGNTSLSNIRALAPAINAAAKKYKVDPSAIAAIIAQEQPNYWPAWGNAQKEVMSVIGWKERADGFGTSRCITRVRPTELAEALGYTNVAEGRGVDKMDIADKKAVANAVDRDDVSCIFSTAAVLHYKDCKLHPEQCNNNEMWTDGRWSRVVGAHGPTGIQRPFDAGVSRAILNELDRYGSTLCQNRDVFTNVLNARPINGRVGRLRYEGVKNPNPNPLTWNRG